MHAGATLSRRFTLLRPGSYDVPGVERWVARDERRSVEVHVDLLTGSAPGEIREAAVRAAQVRDLRFARVLATGRETLGGSRVTYVATETPVALPLTVVLSQRIVPAPVAAAIISEAAHALKAAASLGVHHGFLRAEALHLVDTGRVVISGLGTDGALASQAGLSKKASQAADARALARLHLALVTGLDPDNVMVDDVPEDLSPRAADMARATISGQPPQTFDDVARALSPADSRVLRDVSHTLSSWAWIPGAEPAPLPPIARFGLDVSLGSDINHRAGLAAALVLVGLRTSDDLARTVQAGRTTSLVPAPQVEEASQHLDPGHVPVSEDEAARFSTSVRRAAARDAQKEMGLDTWHTIATEQNRTTPPSVVQAVLEWLHRRWPRSVALSTAAEQARHRARRPAPLRTGPVLVSIFLAITLVAGIVAFEVLIAPFGAGDEANVEPPSHYPEFTYSPEPLPSPSDEGAADAEAGD